MSILKTAPPDSPIYHTKTSAPSSPSSLKHTIIAAKASSLPYRRSLDAGTIKILDFLLNISLIQWLYIVYSFSRGKRKKRESLWCLPTYM